jgi:hypothetical protein
MLSIPRMLLLPNKAAVLGGSLLALVSWQAHATEPEPRAYSNAPAGMNFLIAGYSYSQGGLSTDPTLPIQNAHLDINSGLLAFAHTLDVLGRSGKFDVIMPYSQLSGSALVSGQQLERNVSGLNDPRFRLSVNLIGAPALSRQEFAGYRQDMIVGTSVQVSVPVGQYDPNKLINIGTNRWSVKPDIGISKALGAYTLELSTGVTFFSTNDSYYGGQTLQQDPVYTTQVHLTCDFGNGVWGALDATYDYGGRTTVNGVQNDDSQDNSRFGAMLALPLDREYSVKFFASTGVSIRTGSNYSLGGAALQYRW